MVEKSLVYGQNINKKKHERVSNHRVFSTFSLL